MTVEPLQLRILPPTGPIPPGRGFYQLEEDALYVQIGSFCSRRRFFSYLESDHVHLDFDRQGCLIFIEIDVPRRTWRLDSGFELPHRAEPADVRWLNFRDTISEPAILTNRSRSAVQLQFSERHPAHGFYLAQSVILQTSAELEPVSIWVGDLVDDLAGNEIASFRKSLRREPWLSQVGIPA